MHRVLRYMIVVAVLIGTASLIGLEATTPTKKPKCKAEIFGYGLGHSTPDSKSEDIEKRFGKTYIVDGFAHSYSPIYRSSDKKAYLVFGWSDGGMETIVVSALYPAVTRPKSGASIRTINYPASKLKVACGVALGDSAERVKQLAGKPDTVFKKSYAMGDLPSGTTCWTYACKWRVSSSKPKKQYPDEELEFAFKDGKVARIMASMPEL